MPTTTCPECDNYRKRIADGKAYADWYDKNFVAPVTAAADRVEEFVKALGLDAEADA